MGEKHGKDRAVSFIDCEAAKWLETKAPEDGLCLKRFHADMKMAGVGSWRPGHVVETEGGKKYEITVTGKQCFPECELFKRTGTRCPLAEGVAFGRSI